ncbi:MAG TPA: hypothetical protein VNY56_03425 [Methylomirabilota bacterium]|jgi:hypothetical protein|nr:hypothetical protein [Methylomirabilota bacterium]
MPQNRVSVREFRANLKAHLEGEAAVVIGDFYTTRAILIPMPKHSTWDTSASKKAQAAARKLFDAAISTMK